jgi:hypothetical protein
MENIEEKINTYRVQLGCPCGCNTNRMADDVVMKLMFAEGVYGRPFSFTSGFRCTKHNAAVGGAIDSAHLYGEAADIWYNKKGDCFLIVKALMGAGFERIEIFSLESALAKNKKGAHIHADQHHKVPGPWLNVDFYK